MINNIASGNTYDPTDYEGKLHDWDAVQMVRVAQDLV